ncbi:MAG: thermonuclease family protein [Pseudomonadota bacterium]
MQYVLIAFLMYFCPFTARVDIRVIDGDTFEWNGDIYRLNGIDAPEQGQKCDDWACGTAATRALAELLSGASVSCEIIERDTYGRWVSTCFADGRDLSAAMIDKGLAWAFVKFTDVYVPEELVSRSKAAGVFSGVFLPPWEFRALRWKRAEAEEQKAPEGCPIKGNISVKSGARIYHMPWSRNYRRTLISPEKGERWFCDEAEAIAEGWRAPRWD